MHNEIVELQTRLAFQEDTIMGLSDVLARQQGEIAELMVKLEIVQRQVREFMQMESQAPGEEAPPPHY